MAERDEQHERTYPIGLRIAGRRCVVVGGGRVAERKVRGLLACGAQVHVASLTFAETLAALETITRHEGAYDPAVLDGAALVIAATSDRSLNARVAADARARGIWVNTADDPANCDFYCPAVVRRGALALAIHTGGAAPALARTLRRLLERQFGADWEPLLEALGRLRGEILEQVTDPAERKRRLMRLGDPAAGEAFAAGGVDALRCYVQAASESEAREP